MVTPWTVGITIFMYQAGSTKQGLMQGPHKLPENLLKLALGSDSYNFAMEMAHALQACHYNLDK
ncbi:hypothetical protein H4R20_006747 [Coemansia guatemalensis]|uniref:Uncharacterized protein n=1 Tax=Coemansia guatemalensis TaxID=2761395 RepID=A0A9W8HU68_9FUNG|nr:hypothetical protein H4R20_006747 [Coemansia guatemalensis]